MSKFTESEINQHLQEAENFVRKLPKNLREHIEFETTPEIFANRHSGKRRAHFLTCRFLKTGRVRKASVNLRTDWAKCAPHGLGKTEMFRLKADSFTPDELLLIFSQFCRLNLITVPFGIRVQK